MKKITMISFFGFLVAMVIGFSTPSALARNKVLSLDGDGDYVEVFDSDSLDITDTITLEAWINFREGGTTNPRIVSKGWEATKWGYELVTFTTDSQRPFGQEKSVHSFWTKFTSPKVRASVKLTVQ